MVEKINILIFFKKSHESKHSYTLNFPFFATKFILEAQEQEKIIEIIIRKFACILISGRKPSIELSYANFKTSPFHPCRLYSFPLEILFLGRVCKPAGQGSGFAFTIIPFVHLLPISPLSSFIPPFLVAIPPGCFTVKTHPCPAPSPLFPRLHSLLARQVENPNEILKVWDLIFSPFTLLCFAVAAPRNHCSTTSNGFPYLARYIYLQMNREIRIKSLKGNGDIVKFSGFWFNVAAWLLDEKSMKVFTASVEISKMKFKYRGTLFRE